MARQVRAKMLNSASVDAMVKRECRRIREVIFVFSFARGHSKSPSICEAILPPARVAGHRARMKRI
jgi:hypothetical protein